MGKENEAAWTPDDAICVHAMRCLDNGKATGPKEIDRTIALGPNRYKPNHRLVQRAKMVLEAECGPNAGFLHRQSMLLPALAIVTLVCFAFFVIGKGGIGSPLKANESKELSLVLFILFVGVNLASICLSLFFLAVGAVSHWIAKWSGASSDATAHATDEPSFVWRLWQLFQPLNWVHYGIARALRGIRTLIGWLKNGKWSPGETKFANAFPDSGVNKHQSQWVSLTVAGWTHALWAMVAMVIVGQILVTFGSEQYTFVWRDSISTDEDKAWLIEMSGKPLSWIVPVPDRDDIRWVLNERIDSQSPGGAPLNRTLGTPRSHYLPDAAVVAASQESTSVGRSKSEQARRTLWSRFLVMLVFISAVLPRVLLCCVSLFLADCAQRGMNPIINDDYYRETLKFSDPTEWDEITDPPDPILKPKPPEEGGPDKPPPPVKPSPPKQEPSVVTSTQELGHDLIVLSYEALLKEEDLLNFLPLPKDCRASNLGNVDGAIQRKEMLDRLPQVLAADTAVILFVRAAGIADGSFNQFMSKLRQLVVGKPGLMVILTHLDRLRERWSGDGAQMEMQLKGWRGACAAAEQIVQFDHERPTQGSRKMLGEHLRLFLGDSAPSALSSTRLHLADKFDFAAQYIREAAKHGLERTEADAWREETVGISQRLRKLYDQETTLLEQSVSKLWASKPQLREGLKELTNTLKNMVPDPESVARWGGKAAVLFEVFRNLPTQWGVGGALAGLCVGALPGAVALATLATPLALPVAMYTLAGLPGFGAIGAGLGASLPVAWKKLFRSTANAGVNESSDVVEPVPDLNLDDLTRTAILLALVLELQGNASVVIAEQINSIVGDLQNGLFGTLEQVDHVLDRICERLHKLQA